MKPGDASHTDSADTLVHDPPSLLGKKRLRPLCGNLASNTTFAELSQPTETTNSYDDDGDECDDGSDEGEPITSTPPALQLTRTHSRRLKETTSTHEVGNQGQPPVTDDEDDDYGILATNQGVKASQNRLQQERERRGALFARLVRRHLRERRNLTLQLTESLPNRTYSASGSGLRPKSTSDILSTSSPPAITRTRSSPQSQLSTSASIAMCSPLREQKRIEREQRRHERREAVLTMYGFIPSDFESQSESEREDHEALNSKCNGAMTNHSDNDELDSEATAMNEFDIELEEDGVFELIVDGDEDDEIEIEINTEDGTTLCLLDDDGPLEDPKVSSYPISLANTYLGSGDESDVDIALNELGDTNSDDDGEVENMNSMRQALISKSIFASTRSPSSSPSRSSLSSLSSSTTTTFRKSLASSFKNLKAGKCRDAIMSPAQTSAPTSCAASRFSTRRLNQEGESNRKATLTDIRYRNQHRIRTTTSAAEDIDVLITPRSGRELLASQDLELQENESSGDADDESETKKQTSQKESRQRQQRRSEQSNQNHSIVSSGKHPKSRSAKLASLLDEVMDELSTLLHLNATRTETIPTTRCSAARLRASPRDTTMDLQQDLLERLEAQDVAIRRQTRLRLSRKIMRTEQTRKLVQLDPSSSVVRRSSLKRKKSRANSLSSASSDRRVKHSVSKTQRERLAKLLLFDADAQELSDILDTFHMFQEQVPAYIR